MAPTAQVWKRAFENWMPVGRRAVPGSIIAVLGFAVRMVLSPGGPMSGEIIKGLIAALGALFLYGVGTLLWHLWLAPFSLLNERLAAVADSQEEVKGLQHTLGRTEKKILFYAAIRGEEIEATEAAVKLSQTITFATAAQSAYPACRAAVQELLDQHLIERTAVDGKLNVSNSGHQTVDRLEAADRYVWSGGSAEQLAH